MPLDFKWAKILNALRSESIYLIYVALICVGLFVLGNQIQQWASISFGPLVTSDVVRDSLLGGALTFIGFQSLMSHFLVSIILLGSNLQFPDRKTE